MWINSSSETVSEMRDTLQKTVKGIGGIQDNLRNTMTSVSGWNDAQGAQYRDLMRRIAKLTDSPRSTLVEAVPKLDRMIQALQAYENIKF